MKYKLFIITLMILSIAAFINAQDITATIDNSTGKFIVRNDKPDTLMVVDGKTGNVGIGINNPQERLHIHGDLLAIDLSNNHRGANIMAADEDSNIVNLFVQDTVGYLKTTNDAMDLVLGAGSWGDDIAIKANGNVGIGTLSPDEKLHIAGNMRLDGAFEDKDGDAGTVGQILSSSATGTNWINVATGSDDQKVDIFSISGNNIQLSVEDDGEATKTVDISTTTAVTANTAKVTNATHTGDVAGATTLTIGNDKILEAHLKSVNAPTDEYALTYEATTGDFEWQSFSSGADNLGDHTATQNINLNSKWLSGDGDDEGVYVDSDGRVGIGTTTPDADRKLHVVGNTKIDGDLYMTGKIMPDTYHTQDMGTNTSAWGTIFAKEFEVVGSSVKFFHDGTDAHIITDIGSFHFENNTSNEDINLVIKATGGQDAHFVTDRGGTEHIIISDDGDKIIFMENVDEDLHFWENDNLHRKVHIHGSVEVKDGMQVGDDGTDGQLTIYSEQGETDYSVVFQPNAAMTQNTTYTLPADDGDAGQVLSTDASGVLSWESQSSGTDDQKVDVFSISGNNVQLSVENDGEAAKTVDISTTTAVTANTAKVTDDDDGVAEVYGAGWDADTDSPTKNDVYDKIESLPGGHDAVTLNANATAAGLSLSNQEINYRAATNSQTGYMTGALVTNIETNNAKVSNATHTGDVAGSTTLTIGNEKILEAHLKSVNDPTDEYALTYESDTGDFEWQEMTSGSDNQTIDEFSISGNNIQLSVERDGEATKTVDISTTTAVAANTAKVTNANHTGEVTGTTSLTIDNDALDDQYIELGDAFAGDVTGTYDATTIADDKILERHLKSVNDPTDEYALTYESDTGDFEWQTFPSADNLGNHTATQNINLNNKWLSGDGGDEGVYVDSDGDVGIGTSIPSQTLHVVGTVRFEDVNDGFVESDASGNLSTRKILAGTVHVGDIGVDDGARTVAGDIDSASKTSWSWFLIFGSTITVNFPSLGDAGYVVNMTVEGTSGTKDVDNDLEEPIIYDKTGSSFTVNLVETSMSVQNITLNFIIMDY